MRVVGLVAILDLYSPKTQAAKETPRHQSREPPVSFVLTGSAVALVYEFFCDYRHVSVDGVNAQGDLHHGRGSLPLGDADGDGQPHRFHVPVRRPPPDAILC
jgi:hypothetical protein